MITSSEPLLNCYNPNHVGNSAKYHTGKKCSTRNCEKPAGTLWCPTLCFDCNVVRLKAIDGIYAKRDQAAMQ